MAEAQLHNLSPYQIWFLAARPKTLPAAASPVILGSALAFADGRFHLWAALATLLAALLLQIGANLANDVFDFHKGADARQRLGPMRVTQAGLLTPRQVMLGMWVVFGLAALLGVYLVWLAGWPILAAGLAAIAAALAYTGGPYPYGYHALGEVFVFIFFGLVAVCGTYYIQAQQLSAAVVIASLSMGFLIVAILVVNNLRDIHSDRNSGKMTLAVRLGERNTRIEYSLCLLGAYLVSLVMWLGGYSSIWVMLSWLSLPLAWRMTRFIWRQTGRPLNEALAGTGRLTLVYALLFSFGLVLQVLLSL